MGPANIKPLNNIVNILSSLSSSLSLIITSNENISFSEDNIVYLYQNHCKFRNNRFLKILEYIYFQIKISFYLAKISKDIDIILFYMGETLIIPILTLKLLRKKNILVLCGSLEREIDLMCNTLSLPLILLKFIDLNISNKIIIYSPRLIEIWCLERFRNKIGIAPEHYINLTDFDIKNSFNKRSNQVGYIGRFGVEKGIVNYMKAISLIFKNNHYVHFLVGGDGNLRNEVKKIIDKLDPQLNLEFSGWISHEELPRYLNKLKLIILPSYTEGLPNIMLEAMACGTPVLATPVGAIPDIIKDGETGFIMENNSPDCIAANVIRALEHPDLGGVALRARALVEREFTFERAVERWRKVLEEMCEDR